ESAVAPASSIEATPARATEAVRPSAPEPAPVPPPARAAEPVAATHAPPSAASAAGAQSAAPPISRAPAPEPAAQAPARRVKESGASGLPSAPLDELESLELPSTLPGDGTDAPQAEAPDEPTVEEEIPEDPTVIQHREALAQLDVDRPPEAPSPPPPV